MRFEKPLIFKKFESFLSPVHNLHLKCIASAMKTTSSKSTGLVSSSAICKVSFGINVSSIK